MYAPPSGRKSGFQISLQDCFQQAVLQVMPIVISFLTAQVNTAVDDSTVRRITVSTSLTRSLHFLMPMVK